MDYRKFCKGLSGLGLVSSLFLIGCSVNPATGRNQFTGLMPAESESSIGASQHGEIVKQYGGLYGNQTLQNYVTSVGQKVARNTERNDVNYQFFVLDSPVINAFALPGGYVYVTRGLLAVANDEAELAGVLGHEIGHVTGRHQAARYSQSVLTGLGTTLIGAYVGSQVLSQVLDTGSNLYISSYSRDQESEADTLGIRYVSRAGYDPKAVSDFLAAMDQYEAAQSRMDGKKEEQQVSFFSTHPQTGNRVAAASAEAGKYAPSDVRGADTYLSAINGMMFGDSPEQGFVRGNEFYHPRMEFTFSIPEGYKIDNKPAQIVAASPNGALIVIDRASARSPDPATYIVSEWLEGKEIIAPERITINGHQAATASFSTTLKGAPVEIRLVAINWGRGDVFRMQFAIPSGLPGSEIEGLKRTTYSLRELSASEVASLRPDKISVMTANAGDTIQSYAGRMATQKNAVEMFRALNNLESDQIVPGQKYKVIIR